ncbi:hypothetical protein JOE25_001175 [Serratia sp. PL17]|nr:hypothetical protein [Serratia sp. PL17]
MSIGKVRLAFFYSASVGSVTQGREHDEISRVLGALEDVERKNNA